MNLQYRLSAHPLSTSIGIIIMPVDGKALKDLLLKRAKNLATTSLSFGVGVRPAFGANNLAENCHLEKIICTNI